MAYNILKKRLQEIKNNPTIGKNEKELDRYLKERGIKIFRIV